MQGGVESMYLPLELPPVGGQYAKLIGLDQYAGSWIFPTESIVLNSKGKNIMEK